MPDISVSEQILVDEAKVAMIDAPFNEFERGYPFVEDTVSNVLVAEFENGVEQRRDKWGRTKKRFEVAFNLMNHAQATSLRDFFEQKSGSADTFQFTNPINGITYTVRFLEGTLRIERRFFSSYFATVGLIEVF